MMLADRLPARYQHSATPSLARWVQGYLGRRRACPVPPEETHWIPAIVSNPHLRAGWEPETPVTDSLLRRFLVNWTLGIEAHALSLGGRRLQQDGLAAADV